MIEPNLNRCPNSVATKSNKNYFSAFRRRTNALKSSRIKNSSGDCERRHWRSKWQTDAWWPIGRSGALMNANAFKIVIAIQHLLQYCAAACLLSFAAADCRGRTEPMSGSIFICVSRLCLQSENVINICLFCPSAFSVLSATGRGWERERSNGATKAMNIKNVTLSPFSA